MGLADAFLVDTKAADPLNSNAAGEADPSKVTDFVTKQTFVSLTASTAVVKAIWEGLKQAGEPFGSPLVPLILCGLIGLAQFLGALGDGKLTPRATALAALIALLNVGVLWSAVMGSGAAANEVGVDITSQPS